MRYAKILTMVLRGVSLISKSVLIVILARYLSPEDVGIYGLFTSAVNFLLLLIGLEFYTVTTRELLGRPRPDWPGRIRDQFALVLLIYIVSAAGLGGLFLTDVFPMEYGMWFLTLLFLEHFSQEVYRLLVVAGRPLLATVLLFVRTGAWAYLVVWLITAWPGARSLEVVWIGWFLGGIISVAIGWPGLRGLNWRALRGSRVDWAWIRAGLPSALSLLIGGLAVRAIFTADRFVLKKFVGLEAVGVYSFFMAAALAMQAVTDAGVFVYRYPALVAAFRKGDKDGVNREVRRMTRDVAGLLLACVAGLAVIIGPVLGYIGRDEYKENLAVLWLLLAASAVFCFSMIPHYVLYSQGLDSTIRSANVFGLLLSVLSLFILVPKFGIYGAAAAVLCGFTSMATVKFIIYRRNRNTFPHPLKVVDGCAYEDRAAG